ncbi:circularly permuted type 2 ATP-grasp protein [Microbulbifer sp. ALW1]|uniref:circularly permuted type 2 ATP-grasp protein n=1 Tax=Microbulbifer sp. (strain ALW1) TaxID=1516059 RepID=UPI00135CAC27|nr:circularly permuted type 2 ATP-grasp protein [Microbulbifer sp. ALW1]
MTAIEQPAPHLYDEMLSSEGVHPHYQAYFQWLENTPDASLEQKRREADTLFRRFGITFNVYGEEEGTERLIPFDLIPRIIPASEWNQLELGVRQRVTALNRFLHDIYHDQEILRAGIIPTEQVLTNQQFQTAMLGVDLPGHNYIPITGVDLIRDNSGEYFVLEDNLRTPSGVSYMLENRKMMMRLFPELFLTQNVAPVEHYPNLLLETLQSASDADSPCVVVLTPGRYNSAFFEHAFLAQQMGVPLVEGADLFVRYGCVYMRTTTGPRQVHVIYRRIDDAFLDPLAFNQNSMLGVPGLLSAYRDGNVILANALGTGVADDKSIYPYVPDMIRFYLDEEPILNNVPTWVCRRQEDLTYVLDHLEELVVKEVHGAGGYGMLIGPKAGREELDKFRQLLRSNPANYIAQPTLCLSTCPTMVNEGIAPRHIDLRPFVLSGNEIKLVPGGLTRVALREGSLVVNSSQGGGTKDTWVLEDAPC